jgi:phage shock protein E
MDKPERPPAAPRKPAYMSITTWIIIAVAIVAFLLVKRLTQVAPADAREWLSKGALVIDVRSEAEFHERHLPNVINIPLNRLGEEIVRYAPNKERPLLLHCLSGARSGMGASRLKKLGYQHVFNLGSYGRAEAILRAGGT